MSQISIIGAGTTVRGNLEGEGSLEVLGRVDGDVTMTGDVSVAEGAAVRGHITGERVTVAGSVQGDLRGSQAVLLERGARVVGDLSAPRVGVASGALVRGSVRTEGDATLAPRRAVPPVAKPATLPAVRHAAPTAAKPLAPAAKPAPTPTTSHASSPFAAKPVAKVEPRPPAPAPAEAAVAAPAPVERRPPPPVLPSLGKGAKGKKRERNE
jgi:cytoskeletal protein CcmA (bactofilin family)